MFGREECVHEIVVRFVRKLKSFRLDASVDRLEHIWRQILARVYPSVLVDKLLGGDVDVGVGVVEGGVEHDDGEGEDEAGVLLLEDARVLFTVGRCKRLHDSVNLKSFTRQPGDVQICSDLGKGNPK